MRTEKLKTSKCINGDLFLYEVKANSLQLENNKLPFNK